MKVKCQLVFFSMSTLRTKLNLTAAWNAFFVNPQLEVPNNNNTNKRTYSFLFLPHSKIVELEEELRVVGNNLKSLEVSEEKVSIEICDLNADYMCISLSKYINILIPNILILNL